MNELTSDEKLKIQTNLEYIGLDLNNIPEFIRLLKEENYLEAYKTLSETTVLPGVCGRICPHDKQCQGSCVRGIKGDPVSIGELEAYTFDKAMELGYNLKDLKLMLQEYEAIK